MCSYTLDINTCSSLVNKKQQDCQGICKMKFLKFLEMQGKIYIVPEDAFLCIFFQ